MSKGQGVRLVTLDEVLDRIPYSKVHLYRLMEQGDFPKRVDVGPQRVAWVQGEIDAWIAEKLRRRASGKESKQAQARRVSAQAARAARHN